LCLLGDSRTLEHNALPKDDFDDEELEAYAEECARLAALEVLVEIPEEDLLQLSNHYFQLSYAEEVGSSFDPGVEDMDVWESFMRGNAIRPQCCVINWYLNPFFR
jgi:hypothetical protein